jgi:hypothetical protein
LIRSHTYPFAIRCINLNRPVPNRLEISEPASAWIISCEVHLCQRLAA